MIPFRLGRRLFDLATGPKQWLAVPHADHNNLAEIGGRLYWKTIQSFLEKALTEAKN